MRFFEIQILLVLKIVYIYMQLSLDYKKNIKLHSYVPLTNSNHMRHYCNAIRSKQPNLRSQLKYLTSAETVQRLRFSQQLVNIYRYMSMTALTWIIKGNIYHKLDPFLQDDKGSGAFPLI